MEKKQTKQQSEFPAMFDGLTPPQSLKVSRTVGKFEYDDRWKQHHTGVLHLASIGPRPVDVLFVSPQPLLEELSNRYGVGPNFLKGPSGGIFLRLVHRLGFKDEDFGYTSLVRYNVVPAKPKAADIRWSLPVFHHDLAEFKPKIIVCLGKPPFDALSPIRIKASEMQGAFFDCPQYNCQLYLMDPINYLTSKPEYLEKFATDLKEILWELKARRGSPRIKMAVDYTVIETGEQLEHVVDEMADSGETEIAVDSEWGGQTHVDGKLRAFQFCWKPGRAAGVHFMNEHGERVMDIDDKTVGEILSHHFAKPEVKYLGHYLAADLVWMKTHLGLPIYKKAAFDTMFGLQVVDEYSDLKLERLAVRYTDLGRYDLELFLWKKAAGKSFDEARGYAQIPGDILLPYAIRDVDTTKRVYPYILDQMRKQPGLEKYFFDICLPFVTDCYAQKMMTGLPVDIPYAHRMREIFIRNQKFLIRDFKEEIRKEANQLLFKRLAEIDVVGGIELFRELGSLVETNPDDAFEQFKEFCGQDKFGVMLPLYEHWLAARTIITDDPKAGFNYGSTDHLRRWLFDAKGLMPIKSTKRDGIQCSWAKVLEMDAMKQAEFQPACDKQTLRVYADKDEMVGEVEQLKCVSNIVKSFLRPGEVVVDDETGEETVKEEGIFKWIQSDSRIHTNFAATETGRPRTWNPNILNWPKSVTKPIEAAFTRCNMQLAKEKEAELVAMNVSPALIREVVSRIAFAPISLRSCIKAPQDECFTDADLQTAEVVSLAFLSGDRNMIAASTADDEQFGFKTDSKDILAEALALPDDPRVVRKVLDAWAKKKVAKLCRVVYDNSITRITADAQDASLLTNPDDEHIIRGSSGKILHPRRDVHWMMAESYMNKPRERLDKELHRGSGKVGMFAIPYGASGTLIERQTYALTGVKPDPGTGDKIIEAYKSGFSLASTYLEERERDVEERGYFQSVSGRIRHSPVKLLQGLNDISRYEYESIVSSLKREFRNYPLQEIVAATMARAHAMLLDVLQDRSMKSRPMLLLYDALTVVGPLEERHDVKNLLQWAMSDANTWETPGGTLQFEVDIDHSFRWATKLTESERKLLLD